MNMIESARFDEFGAVEAVIDGIEMVVPDAMANRHRQMIAEWVAEGNTIQPYEPPPEPLLPLSPRQLLLAALSIGVTEDDIVAMIEAIEDEETRAVARIEWGKAQAYDRDHWLVEELRQEMEFDPVEFDDLWRWAAGL